MSTVAIGKDADVQLMVDVAKWGTRPLLLHRGLADDPAHLHAGDAARPRRHRSSSSRSVRSSPHPATRRCRRSTGRTSPPLGGYVATTLKTHGRPGADEPPGGSRPRHLAIRAGPLGRVHLGRQGQVGRALAAVARLQQVLGAAHALDAPERLAQRHRRDRRATGQHGRDRRRRRRPQGRIHQLPRLAGRRGGAEPRADGDRSRAGRHPAVTAVVFPAGQEGVYLVGMAQRRNERVVGSQLAGLVVPYAQELRDLGVDETAAPRAGRADGRRATRRSAATPS